MSYRCDRITVNGAEYVRADIDADDLGVRIVVLQRGWVVVGHARRHGQRVRVTNCAVVRRWGTTKGLGQLAIEGLQSQTILDECPPVECLESEVVMSMETTHESWASRA